MRYTCVLHTETYNNGKNYQQLVTTLLGTGVKFTGVQGLLALTDIAGGASNALTADSVLEIDKYLRKHGVFTVTAPCSASD